MYLRFTFPVAIEWNCKEQLNAGFSKRRLTCLCVIKVMLIRNHFIQHYQCVDNWKYVILLEFLKNDFTVFVFVCFFVIFYYLSVMINLLSKECDSNTFGQDCVEECGNCVNDEQCHHINGTCLHGCKRGFQGIECNQGNPECNYFRRLWTRQHMYCN